MTGRALLLLGVGAAVAFGLGWRLTIGRSRPSYDWSLLRICLGAGAVIVSIVAGAGLIEVKSLSPPAQRAVGALVGPSENKIPVRQHANPLTVTTVVDVSTCDSDVQVRLTVTPNSSFWRRHAARFPAGAVDLDVAIPGSVVGEVTANAGDDGLEGILSPGLEISGSSQATVESGYDRASDTTRVTVTVDDWARANVPVSLLFAADWTTSRSMLGGCYVSLPALTGIQTSLAASEIVGQAAPIDEALPEGGNLFVVTTSSTPRRQAYYNSRFEVTRGVSILVLHDNTLVEGGSGPAPNANLGGNNAWTCRSTLIDGFGSVSNANGPVPDLNLAPDEDHYTISGERLDEIVAQENCASFVAIQEGGAGTRRDLVLIMIGALFSFGVELFLSGFHRQRPA